MSTEMIRHRVSETSDNLYHWMIVVNVFRLFLALAQSDDRAARPILLFLGLIVFGLAILVVVKMRLDADDIFIETDRDLKVKKEHDNKFMVILILGIVVLFLLLVVEAEFVSSANPRLMLATAVLTFVVSRFMCRMGRLWFYYSVEAFAKDIYLHEAKGVGRWFGFYLADWQKRIYVDRFGKATEEAKCAHLVRGIFAEFRTVLFALKHGFNVYKGRI